jgi:hypothetical protein
MVITKTAVVSGAFKFVYFIAEPDNFSGLSEIKLGTRLIFQKVVDVPKIANRTNHCLWWIA